MGRQGARSDGSAREERGEEEEEEERTHPATNSLTPAMTTCTFCDNDRDWRVRCVAVKKIDSNNSHHAFTVCTTPEDEEAEED